MFENEDILCEILSWAVRDLPCWKEHESGRGGGARSILTVYTLVSKDWRRAAMSRFVWGLGKTLFHG